MTDNIINYNGFYKRKTGNGSAYNYDLMPLITNFSFYDFINEGKRKKDNMSSHGGFLVITNNQYIVGYNAGFGCGTHLSSFARTMKDMQGGGDIFNLKDAVQLNTVCVKNFLCARFLFEYSGKDKDNNPVYDGNLFFLLEDIGYKITPQQFEVFKKFYEYYNDDIKYVISKVGTRNFEVRFNYVDEKGQKFLKYCDSLDDLYEYLSKCIDYSKVIEHESVIISTETKNHIK